MSLRFAALYSRNFETAFIMSRVLSNLTDFISYINNRQTSFFFFFLFDVLLTVHLSTILVINQLNAQILVL